LRSDLLFGPRCAPKIAITAAAIMAPIQVTASAIASSPACVATPLTETSALELARKKLEFLGYSEAAVARAEVFGLFEADELDEPSQFDVLVPRDGYVWHFFGNGSTCGISLRDDGYYTLDGLTYYKDTGKGSIPLRRINKT